MRRPQLIRDEGLKQAIGEMREYRQSRERDLTRGLEIEQRGIAPLREYRTNPRYGRDRQTADEAWARHAAEKGLGVEHIRDELLKERQRSHQYDHTHELEQASRLAEREVKRVRGIEHDRGYRWSH